MTLLLDRCSFIRKNLVAGPGLALSPVFSASAAAPGTSVPPPKARISFVGVRVHFAQNGFPEPAAVGK